MDRDTTLPELLAQTARLPDNVVETLVGEAFNRLDPLAQQVMQTLAVFTAAVPSVAVDYLLQPYRNRPSTPPRCSPGWSTCSSSAARPDATTCIRSTVTTPSAAFQTGGKTDR